MEWAARPFCSLVESFPQGIYPLLEESPAFRGAQCRLMAAPLSGRKFDYIIINVQFLYTYFPVFYSYVGLQYILDSEKKKDEGFARIGYCEFRKNNKDRKEVQIPHGKCNTGHEVQAIPNVLREEIWRSTSVAEI